MKIYIGLILILALLLCGCRKDNGLTDFRAEIDHFYGRKMFLDSEGYACWQTNDIVNINGQNYPIVVDDHGGATISGVAISDHGYRAIYAFSASANAQGYSIVTLPHTQVYRENVIQMPMVAYADNNDSPLLFRHICSLMRVTVSGVGSISSIQVSASVPLSGNGMVQGTDESPVLVLDNDQPNEVELDCGNIQISGQRDFYIIIPPVSDPGNKFTITVNGRCIASDGTWSTSFSRTQPAGGSMLQRGQIGSVRFDLTSDANETTSTGMLCGEFSVANGRKVSFSKGNLQYDVVNSSWSFADHQWTYIGTANLSNGNLANVIDLFGWATGSCPTMIDGESNNYYRGSHDMGSTEDWGSALGENGFWRTLSKDEWSYLLSSRANASQLKAVGRVAGALGLILLPDNWSSLATLSGEARFSAEEWKPLQQKGAVFLPAAGYRQNVSNGQTILNAGDWGCYWTTRFYLGNMAYALLFKVDTIVLGYSFLSSSTQYIYRKHGLSVRLVHQHTTSKFPCDKSD